MGLDLDHRELSGTDAGAAPASPVSALRDFAEAAIQRALRMGEDHLSFATPESLRGREGELSALCTDLQKKYPGLQEIVPHFAAAAAVAYLNKKPGAVAKFIHRIATPDM